MSTLSSLGPPANIALASQATITPRSDVGRRSDERASVASVAAKSQHSEVPAQDKTAPSSEDLRKLVSEMQRMISARTSDLQFSVDGESGKTIVKITDRTTKEIVWQFPSEQAMKIAKEIDRFQQGFMINKVV